MLGQSLGIPNPATTDEIEEGRPWWKVCCAGCCLGVVVLLVLFWAMLRYFSGPGPKVVDRIPASFPSQLVLFRPEDATEIIHYPSASKSAMTKIVTGPLSWVSGLAGPAQSSATGSVRAVSNAIGAQLKGLEGRDTVAIRWTNLSASRDEVLRWYAGALDQVGIRSRPMRSDTEIAELMGESATLAFSLLITDDPMKFGLDSVSVVVEYPVETK